MTHVLFDSVHSQRLIGQHLNEIRKSKGIMTKTLAVELEYELRSMYRFFAGDSMFYWFDKFVRICAALRVKPSNVIAACVDSEIETY